MSSRVKKYHVDLEGASFDADAAVTVSGSMFGIGVPVFRWDHPKGYNGYTTKRVEVKDDSRRSSDGIRVIEGRRYRSRVLDQIRQFVIHHTGGDGPNPRNMYETLWNQRGLSVQYAIEDDGRVWQFLDAGDLAWHAGTHNRISVGAECCLYPLVDQRPDYYSPERNKKTGNLPHDIVEDEIHGRKIRVFAFTDLQVESLSRVIAATWIGLHAATGHKAFVSPPRFPRRDGEIPRTVVQNALSHIGMIGHLQCTRNKIDPAGFPWERCEARVCELFVEWRLKVGRT